MYEDLDFLLRGGGGGMDLPAPDDLAVPKSNPFFTQPPRTLGEADAYRGMLGEQTRSMAAPPQAPAPEMHIPRTPMFDAMMNAKSYNGPSLTAPRPVTSADYMQSQPMPSSRMSAILGGGMPYQGATISPEADGSRPYDPFNSGLQPSPFMVKDSFMENGPVHTLGYSSRHGISQPTVDYSGMMQRAGVDRHNMEMSRMLGNQEIARNNASLDLQKMMLMSEDRNNSIMERKQRDYNMAMQKTMPGSRGDLIDRYERDKVLTPKEAQQDRLKDMFTGALGQVKKDQNGNPTDMGRFLGIIGSKFDPAKASKSDMMDMLMQHGVTLEQMMNELVRNRDNIGLRSLIETLSKP